MVSHPHGGEIHEMSDVILVVTVLAFFLVAAAVAWACSRITADAAIEAESETGAIDGEPERT